MSDAITETSTETPDAETPAVVLTLAEQIRTAGDGSLAVEDTEVEKLVEETAAYLVEGLPSVRTVRGVYRQAAGYKLRLAMSVTTKVGHPDWAMRSGAFRILWQSVLGRAAEGMPVEERPSVEEWETYNAGIRQAVMRGLRDETISEYVKRTKNGAAEMDPASAPFKRLLKAEYDSANLLVPKHLRSEGDQTGSGTGAGPERDPQIDAYNVASSGVAGLYDPDTESGVNEHLHAATILKSITLFAQRVLDSGEIHDRNETSQILVSGEALLELINQRVGAPETFGEAEAGKLREEIKLAEKLIEDARK